LGLTDAQHEKLSRAATSAQYVRDKRKQQGHVSGMGPYPMHPSGVSEDSANALGYIRDHPVVETFASQQEAYDTIGRYIKGRGVAQAVMIQYSGESIFGLLRNVLKETLLVDGATLTLYLQDRAMAERLKLHYQLDRIDNVRRRFYGDLTSELRARLIVRRYPAPGTVSCIVIRLADGEEFILFGIYSYERVHTVSPDIDGYRHPDYPDEEFQLSGHDRATILAWRGSDAFAHLHDTYTALTKNLAITAGPPEWPTLKGVIGPHRARVQVPARISLAGDHLDYLNAGPIFVAAIDKYVTSEATISEDRDHTTVRSRLVPSTPGAELFNTQEYTYPPAAGMQPSEWQNYVHGLFAFLDSERVDGQPSDWQEMHHVIGPQAIHVRGLRIEVESSVPINRGLGSSAAFLTAIIRAILAVRQAEIPDVWVAKLAQRVENEYVRVHSGLGDEIAALFGQPAHVLYVDLAGSQDPRWQYPVVSLSVPNDWAFLILDTGATRTLQASQYNAVRLAMGSAWIALKQKHPSVTVLGQVTQEMVNDLDADTRPFASYLYQETTNVDRLKDTLVTERTLSLIEFCSALNKTEWGLETYFERFNLCNKNIVDTIRRVRELASAAGGRRPRLLKGAHMVRMSQVYAASLAWSIQRSMAPST